MTFLKFDPNIGKLGPPPIFVLGGGFLDTIFGGDKRRLKTFNDAII